MQPFENVVAEHGAVVLQVWRTLLGSIDADDTWSATILDAFPATRSGQQRARLASHNRASPLPRPDPLDQTSRTPVRMPRPRAESARPLSACL